jgi:hypothetical protein
MRHFRTLVSILIFLATMPSVWSHQPTSQSAPRVSPPSPDVIPNKGSIEQGTYKNPSIGVEFTPAENLHLEDPEMEGTPGAAKLLIRIKAIEGGLLSGILSPRSVTIFYADALAYYPENQRGTPLYVDKVIRANKAFGYQTVNEVTQDQINGITFVRVDFVKGDVHESVFVTTHNAYAFVFIFAGSDFGSINKIIASTKVRLTR